MKRSVSTKASRPRTAWFPIIVKLGGIYEINIGWRYYDGSVGFYSAAARTCGVKPPWGQVVSCDFNQASNKRGELHDYFKFQNEIGQKLNFKIVLMNALLFGVNNFTQKIAAMRTGGQDRLLAQYFSLLPRSEGFSHHKTDQHTKLGLLKDDAGDALNEQEVEDLELFSQRSSHCS
jgi:hypothetical protein